MQENKDLYVRFDDAITALDMTQEELKGVTIALDEILEEYDSTFALNAKDAYDYGKGNTKNNAGRASWKFITDHRRIMWLARTARMYCEQAQKVCEGVLCNE